ncbi:PREDICTED: zinc finger HIT domain-containing protein 3-like [Amphimedon queenslandica]|uniref:Zinc finger HIT domain-containing protein n=1 Tax=Amphimedon queenslandica TaxID=400682 RepID=A0A1X7UIA8_AMPQE|nr:PREDICTED: zinc finger HIT domain-containing protein 3-like [Amphimedon queenslandica]|eukprot:XP_019854140.1 PREDICTED: zinc finger HIT domain-containing protein 3-like [Amphimedon queenslandica]
MADALVTYSESDSEGELGEEVELQSESDDDDIDKVPEEKLQSLEFNVSLRDMLCNPHLRKVLTGLDKHPDPASILDRLMEVPIFKEFADECLKICGESENDA